MDEIKFLEIEIANNKKLMKDSPSLKTECREVIYLCQENIDLTKNLVRKYG